MAAVSAPVVMIAIKTFLQPAGVWLHGEAVAAGMVMAADMSLRLGWIEESILTRTRALLQRAKLPIEPPKVTCYFSFAEKLPQNITVCCHALLVSWQICFQKYADCHAPC